MSKRRNALNKIENDLSVLQREKIFMHDEIQSLNKKLQQCKLEKMQVLNDSKLKDVEISALKIKNEELLMLQSNKLEPYLSKLDIQSNSLNNEEEIFNIYENKISLLNNEMEYSTKFKELINNKQIIDIPTEYIYILHNETFPNYLKIGMTERHPTIRLTEINSETGVPTPYKIAFFVRCFSAREIEYKVHQRLHESRIHNRKEFFELDLKNAIEIISEVIEQEFIYIDFNVRINNLLSINSLKQNLNNPSNTEITT